MQRGDAQKAAEWREKYDADFSVREGVYERLKGADQAQAEAHAEAIFHQQQSRKVSEQSGGSGSSAPTTLLRGTPRTRISQKNWHGSAFAKAEDIKALNSKDAKVRKKARNRIGRREGETPLKAADRSESMYRLSTARSRRQLTGSLPPSMAGELQVASQHSSQMAHVDTNASHYAPHSPSSISTSSVAQFSRFLKAVKKATATASVEHR